MNKREYRLACRQVRMVLAAMEAFDYQQAAHDLHWLYEFVDWKYYRHFFNLFLNHRDRYDNNYIVGYSFLSASIYDVSSRICLKLVIDPRICAYRLLDCETGDWLEYDIAYDCGISH